MESILEAATLYSIEGNFNKVLIKIICDGETCKHQNKEIQISGNIPEGLMYIYEDATIDM